MPNKQRIMLLSTAAMLFVGIGLSGWSNVHWFLYVTPCMLGLFGVTGICPAQIRRKLLKRKRL